MKLFLYTVHDRAVNAYLSPYYARTEAEAIRSLENAARDPNHAFSQHPGDYRLFALGSYDDATARFDLLPAPVFVTSVEQLLAQLLLPLGTEKEAAE